VQIVTPAKAAAVARAATARLAAMVEPDGRFLYRYYPDNPAFVNDRYGEVRHVASVWAMIDFEREGWPIAGLSEAIDRAADFMHKRLFRPYGATDTLCVIDEGFVKLGGSAMGVAAELALYGRSGDPTLLERADRLARFVESQSLDNGEFVQVRIPGPLSAPHPMRAAEFTGQPVLALALMAETTGEGRWLDLALKQTAKLAERGHGVGSMTHWMVYALEVMVRIRRQQWLIDYAARLAAWMLSDEATRRSREATPLACQTEGLLAYARILDALGEDGEPSLDDVLKQIGRNLRRQLRFFHTDGGFFRSLDVREVRIDYIDHHVIGFLGYARLMRAREHATGPTRARKRTPAR
jgi:hypothetical protein